MILSLYAFFLSVKKICERYTDPFKDDTMSAILILATCVISGVVSQSMFMDLQPIVANNIVPYCPLEAHPDTETMFIMRGPLGNPEPRTCPPNTYFLQSVCSCVHTPKDKCNLRPSVMGHNWYEEYVHGMWMTRPCGPGTGFNQLDCECSMSA